MAISSVVLFCLIFFTPGLFVSVSIPKPSVFISKSDRSVQFSTKRKETSRDDIPALLIAEAPQEYHAFYQITAVTQPGIKIVN